MTTYDPGNRFVSEVALAAALLGITEEPAEGPRFS